MCKGASYLLTPLPVPLPPVLILLCQSLFPLDSNPIFNGDQLHAHYCPSCYNFLILFFQSKMALTECC